ncbi:MAG: ferritin-like domain-containing protein [Nonomuraea sp.]|nr:ferritin-like domain-containing protein [Nonomuraea sp.]
MLSASAVTGSTGPRSAGVVVHRLPRHWGSSSPVPSSPEVQARAPASPLQASRAGRRSGRADGLQRLRPFRARDPGARLAADRAAAAGGRRQGTHDRRLLGHDRGRRRRPGAFPRPPPGARGRAPQVPSGAGLALPLVVRHVPCAHSVGLAQAVAVAVAGHGAQGGGGAPAPAGRPVARRRPAHRQHRGLRGGPRRVPAEVVVNGVVVSGDDIDKLRKALAAEHAAVFAYGLLGARTSGALRDLVTSAYDAHRARRDQLRALITARGAKPSEAAASYALPFFPSNATLAARLAVRLEDGLTAAYLELTAAQDTALRKYAALAMQQSATRAYTFRPAQPPAFPGMPTTTPPTPSPLHTGG